MNLKILKYSFLIFFILTNQNNLFSLEISDKDKLKNIGYVWSSFYRDNYRGKKVKWFSLEDHLKIKPKFLALVEQDLKINGKKESYQYIYNSKHNFFKMQVTDENKKITPILRNPLRKKTLGPKIIEDNDIDLSQFIEKVLDHCKFSSVAAVSDENGKKLNFRNEEECKIIYVNFDKFKNLSFQNFEKDQNLQSYNPLLKSSSDNKIKNIEIQKKTKVNEKKLATSKTINNFKNSIALSWVKNSDLLVGDISYNAQTNSGVIKFDTKNNGKCMGTFNLMVIKGTWSFSCKKNNTTAFGEIYLNNGIIEGEGFDKKKNKIKFVSKKIDE